MKIKNIAIGDFVQIKKSMFHLEFEAGEYVRLLILKTLREWA